MTASDSNLSSFRHHVIVKNRSSANIEEGFFTPAPLNCLPEERNNDCVLLDDRDYILTDSGLVTSTNGFFLPVVPSALINSVKSLSLTSRKVVVPTRIPKTLHPSESAYRRAHPKSNTTIPVASSLASPSLFTKTVPSSGAKVSQTVNEKKRESALTQKKVKVPSTRKQIQTTTVKPTVHRRTKPLTTTTTTISSMKPIRFARPGPHQLDSLWVDVGTVTPYSTSSNAIPFVFTTTTPFITSILTTQLPSRRTTALLNNKQSEEVDSGDESGLPDGDAIDNPDTMRVKVTNDYRMTESPLFAVRPTTPMGLPITSLKPYTASGSVADFPRTQLILIASMSLIILIALVVFWVFCWCQQQTNETKTPNCVAAGYVPIPTDSTTPPEMRICMATSRGPIPNSMIPIVSRIRSTTSENGIVRHKIQHNNAINGNGGVLNGVPPTMNAFTNDFSGPKPNGNELGPLLLNGGALEKKKDFKEWYV